MIYFNNNHINILTKHVPGPERLNIELTTSCNIKCIMCRGKNSYVKDNNAGKFLRVEDFVTVLNGTDLNRLKLVNLAGNAESLLNPDIVPILNVCRENNIIVELITNGTLLTPQISKLLLGFCSEIHISFGGSTKQTFESIRQGAEFELVCENIRTLSDLKKSTNNQYPHIWLNPILMKRSIQELPDIIKLAMDLGCQGVACSHLIVSSPELIEESLYFHKTECNTFLQKAEVLAKEYDIKLIIPRYFTAESSCDEGNNGHKEAWKNCRFLWNHAILGVEGIEPCGSYKNMDFDGNIVRNRFMDIWNNDWYANMRYMLLTGNPPDICKVCKDPSVKDVNNIGSYFTDEFLPEAIAYAQTLETTHLSKDLELSC
ncbi:MAG: radical SAM protein [Candidatus Scalindua rubra]|uniref:Cofactor modifying protein n=1 Tax=Candidatus Scalindua brodae TaxID=237368 RepID=A0A0B0EHJ8_9BACT|nr:MAG: cofactor modifying protein [Candidatus Scalindua brodae]MBZ0108292.1 radical SAM protein [Candidatus Scalindua rubra]TWU33989.1 pyrroloquinoline quinone biosynthesis protein PqqE [Candidatus Brocadiaceae bacterium S225]